LSKLQLQLRTQILVVQYFESSTKNDSMGFSTGYICRNPVMGVCKNFNEGG
jgi:hypothetical protein